MAPFIIPRRAVIVMLFALAAVTLVGGCSQKKEEHVPHRKLRALKEAKDLSATMDLQTISHAVYRYYMENNALPQGDWEDALKVLVPAYMPAPRYEINGMPIRYKSSGTEYELRTWGPDETWFTADDIVVKGP